MSVRLTSEQMVIIKGLMEYAQAFCDQVFHIMQNHGLDKVNGCSLSLYVDPKCQFVNENVVIGNSITEDFGRIQMSKGLNEMNFSPLGKNSAEYELLFATGELKEALRKVLMTDEKPLPQDGLWVGNDNGEE